MSSPEPAFPLSSIRPEWSGQLLVSLREQLQRGLALAEAELSDCPVAVCTLISDFDSDGLFEAVESISAAQSNKAAEDLARSLHDRAIAGLLDVHPGWRILRRQIRGRSFLDREFPPHFIGSRIGGGTDVDYCDVRVWLVALEGGPTTLASLLTILPMEQEYVGYFLKLGSTANPT